MKLKHSLFNKTILGLVVLLSAAPQAFAAETKQAPVIYLNNSLFWVLFLIILILLFTITTVSSVIKNLAETETPKPGTDKFTQTPVIVAIILGASLLSGGAIQAQEAQKASVSIFEMEYAGLSSGVFWIMVCAIAFELFVLAFLLIIMRKMLRTLGIAHNLAEINEPFFNFSKFSESFNDAVPLEDEASIATDHEYDGIRELDNNLPPWWKYGFYLSIVVAIIYMLHYHVFKTGKLQLAEYQTELTNAEYAKNEYLKTVADKVDENSVVALTEASAISTGKTIYKEKCVACHGANGEGGVGPNLTDDFWLHGGGVKNIFKTIKYGVPAKGMIAWQAQLKPVEMQELASFIITIHGTKPAGEKAPQGEPYTDTETPAKTDVTAGAATTDSLTTVGK